MTVQQTSKEAYRDIEPTLGERQAVVYGELQKHENRTNTELAQDLGSPINTITPRIYELRKLGMVHEDCKRECSITGRNVIAWRAGKPRELKQTTIC